MRIENKHICCCQGENLGVSLKACQYCEEDRNGIVDSVDRVATPQ